MKQSTRIRLIEERKHRQWSQQKLADYLGTTQHNVSRWEQGLTTPGPYFRTRLSALFGKSAQELGLLSEDFQQPGSPEAFVALPAETLPASPSLWEISYPRNPLFTGREALLSHLHEQLAQAHTITLTQSPTIKRPGGVGKTQIALEYAYRYQKDYRFIFWIDAATREALLLGLVTITNLLSLPEKDEHDHNRTIQVVKQWLATHQTWLLILDNADDISVVHDVVPIGATGHLLLTSCAQEPDLQTQQIEVPAMETGEGALFLLRRAGLLAPDESLDCISQEHLASVEATVTALDSLPLALDQAGAYIENTGCSLTTYLNLYQAQREKGRNLVSSDHSEPIATACLLNLQHVMLTHPVATEFLHLCAFLQADAIPDELIRASAAFADQGAVHALVLNEAIKVLHKMFLTQRQSETRLSRIHRSIQLVLRETIEKERQHHLAERVVRAINALFPQIVNEATESMCRRYLLQAYACSNLVQEFRLTSTEAISLLFRVASYLQDGALYEYAQPLFQQAVHMCESTLASNHLEVIQSLHTLAALGNRPEVYAKAASLYQSVVSLSGSQGKDQLERGYRLPPAKSNSALSKNSTRRTLLKGAVIGLGLSALVGGGGLYWLADSPLSPFHISHASDAYTSSSLLYIYHAPSAVIAVEWSPQGDAIGCAKTDETATVITILSGSYFPTVERSALNCLAWSPDGTQIASPVNDGTIQIWDPINGVNAQRFPAFSVPAVSAIYPEGIAWSSDRKRIALSSTDGLISIWNVDSGTLFQTYRGHKGTVWWIAWSPDHTRLASAGADARVRIWDTVTGKILLTYTEHTRAVMDVEWSSTGRWIVSASEDTTVRVWDAHTGETALVYRGHIASVQTADWSPDDRMIASSGADTTVQIWNAQTGKRSVTDRGHTNTVWMLSWSPDGRRLASSSQDRTMRVWQVKQ